MNPWTGKDCRPKLETGGGDGCNGTQQPTRRWLLCLRCNCSAALSRNLAVSAASEHLAHGARSATSPAQRLLQLRSISSPTGCAPEAGLQKLQHFAGPCVTWCSAQLSGVQGRLQPYGGSDSFRCPEVPIASSEPGHASRQQTPLRSPVSPSVPTGPCVATEPPLPDLPVPRGSLVNAFGTQCECMCERRTTMT